MSQESTPRPKKIEKQELEESEIRLETRTEAAKLLTRIVGLLVPESIRAHGDIDTFTFPENKIIEDQSPNDVIGIELDKSIDTLMRKMEKLGLGLTISEHTYAYTENPETGTVSLNALLTPWDYMQNGELYELCDSRKIRQQIKRLTDPKKQSEALRFLDEFEYLLKTEKINSPKRYIESLQEPSREALTDLQEKLHTIDESIIYSVEGLTSGEDALRSPDRKRLQEIYFALYPEWNALYRGSKLEIDSDKSQYPDFWRVQSQLYRLYNAIGAINRGLVRHDMVKI